MRIIDLSTPFDMNFIIPQRPTLEQHLEMRLLLNVPRDGCQVTKFTLLTHCGTHMDVPAHRFTREEKPKGIFYLEDVPLEWLFGETVVLNMPKGELEPITAKDFENAAIEIREGDIVLVHTGWGRYFEEEPKNWVYLFTKCPGLEVDGAEWLVKKKVRAYGQDTIGTQHPSHSFRLDDKSRDAGIPRMAEPVHDLLLMNEILLLEHLTNLDKVANRRIKAGFFPLPLKGVDGAPIRALAFLED